MGGMTDLNSMKSQKTVRERIQNEIVWAMSPKPGQPEKKNKVILAIINIFPLLTLCGVDRCYMGSWLLGCLKGITLGGICFQFGGFGIWGIVDYIIFMFNALGSYTSIDMLGFVAEWEEGTVTPAFWLAVFMIVKWILLHCCDDVPIIQEFKLYMMIKQLQLIYAISLIIFFFCHRAPASSDNDPDEKD